MDPRPSQGMRDLDDGGVELWAPTEEALFTEAGRAAIARIDAGQRITAVEMGTHPHGVWARLRFERAGAPLLRLPQPYQEIEHTADLGVRVRGATAEETLARLVCVFGRLLAGTDDAPVGPRVRIAVPGADLPLAAADILRELLYRFATERVVPSACRTLRLDAELVEVEAALAPWDPDHGGADIKAVTLHQLRFEPDADGWLAQVVFDV